MKAISLKDQEPFRMSASHLRHGVLLESRSRLGCVDEVRPLITQLLELRITLALCPVISLATQSLLIFSSQVYGSDNTANKQE